MSEAFIYLWYDALNKMYYLGKHKGSPDDRYTHSSTIWESFTKDNIPEGVTREILAEGTHEEMCVLEHELLVKAKNGEDWDRYYNESLGDPRYIDQSGENNPNYKHGSTVGKNSDAEIRRKWDKLWQPIYRAKNIEKYRAQEKIRSQRYRDKKKAETGFAKGYSQAKKKAETQGEGTLKAFLK